LEPSAVGISNVAACTMASHSVETAFRFVCMIVRRQVVKSFAGGLRSYHKKKIGSWKRLTEHHTMMKTESHNRKSDGAHVPEMPLAVNLQ
jgi:hypothetical protein